MNSDPAENRAALPVFTESVESIDDLPWHRSSGSDVPGAVEVVRVITHTAEALLGRQALERAIDKGGHERVVLLRRSPNQYEDNDPSADAVMTFTDNEWDAFVKGVIDGEFDSDDEQPQV